MSKIEANNCRWVTTLLGDLLRIMDTPGGNVAECSDSIASYLLETTDQWEKGGDLAILPFAARVRGVARTLRTCPSRETVEAMLEEFRGAQ